MTLDFICAGTCTWTNLHQKNFFFWDMLQRQTFLTTAVAAHVSLFFDIGATQQPDFDGLRWEEKLAFISCTKGRGSRERDFFFSNLSILSGPSSRYSPHTLGQQLKEQVSGAHTETWSRNSNHLVEPREKVFWDQINHSLEQTHKIRKMIHAKTWVTLSAWITISMC